MCALLPCFYALLPCWCRYNIKQKNFPKELFEVRMYVLRPQQQQTQTQS